MLPIAEEYLAKIVKLCQEEGIQLILTNIPSDETQDYSGVC